MDKTSNAKANTIGFAFGSDLLMKGVIDDKSDARNLFARKLDLVFEK